MKIKDFTERELYDIARLPSNAGIDLVSKDNEVCEYCWTIMMDDLGCDNCEGEDS